VIQHRQIRKTAEFYVTNLDRPGIKIVVFEAL